MKTMSFDFNSRRSMVIGRRGLVSTSNPLAAQAGLDILRQWGHRIDRYSEDRKAGVPASGDKIEMYYIGG
ncbi:MAG: hypothetical protein AAFR56_20970 [Chloroflexota bacterium]